MQTSEVHHIVKSDNWTHEQLDGQTVTFKHPSGVLVPARFTAVPRRGGMQVLVRYQLDRLEAANHPVTQVEIDKIQLYPGGSTKFRLF